MGACSRWPVRRALRWATQRIVSISLIALLLLCYIALVVEPRRIAAANRLEYASQHGDSTDGSQSHRNHHSLFQYALIHLTSFFWSTPPFRLIYVGYSVFVHIMGAVFPFRACIAINAVTRDIQRRLARRSIISSGTPTESLTKDSVIHAILLPNYAEDLDSLRETCKVLASHEQAKQCYHLFLAMEAAEAGGEQKAQTLVSEFEKSFRNITYTMHPRDIPGESRGKSSNLAWAARVVMRMYADVFSVCDVIVTVMDADSHLSTNYFGSVTDLHRAHPQEANTTVYVAPIVFDRNFTEVPRFVRVADIMWCGAGLSGLSPIEVIRFPTSVYSLPLSLVKRVGGWDAGPEAIGEDMHMYLKCFFAMKGNLTSRVIASAASQTNVHSDAAGFGGWVGSHQARYKQAIRHMWGSLDTGYAFIRVAETMFAPDFCDVESEADSDGDSPYMSPVASVSGLEELSVHWIHYILLFGRLFEAHFLPVHLIALAIASTLFKLFASAESRARELAWEFEFDGYLRILGFLGVVTMFFMYRRYHLICTQARREEMQRAGLEADLNEEFKDWPLLTYLVDSFSFPVGGLIFGAIPSVHATIMHFFTLNLTYTVSAKPKKLIAQMTGIDRKA